MKKSDITDMSLGDRMKIYESQYETSVDVSKHIIVRCDGHKFSKFTKGFEKPFDKILSKAMELTTIDLVDKFNATTGFTQSDEITLVISSFKDSTVDNRESTKHKLKKKLKQDWNHEYSGRVQKMVSLIAGFTTMKFNKHLNDLVLDFQGEMYSDFGITESNKKYPQTLESKLGNAWFDARVYGVDSDEEAFNSVLWRYKDCIKNSKSMFSQYYCSHKELHKLNGEEQIKYSLDKTGYDWNKLRSDLSMGF